MRGITLCSFLFLVSLTLCCAYSTGYHGLQQWQVNNITENHIEDVRRIVKEFHLDVLSSTKTSLDFLVEPETQKLLGNTLASLGIHYEVLVMNFQTLIDDEMRHLMEESPSVGIDISDFNDYETISAYMKELADQYDWVSVESIGQTIEGRDLWVATLAVASADPKPSVWIDCGIHAREWLTHSTCVFGLDYLTKGYSTLDEVTSFLDKYDVRILPVYNPDGYVTTWTDDRNWRKNRVPTEVLECLGVDLNRNLDGGHWDGPYSSDWPCDYDFRGVSAFSEKETQSVRDYIEKLTDKPTAYFNLHTMGEMWMYPYGYTEELAPDHDELDRLAKIAVDALEAVHGTRYDYGPISTTIYPVNGDVVDWAYTYGITYAYTMELRGPSFVVPATEIIPTAEETWAGILALVMTI